MKYASGPEYDYYSDPKEPDAIKSRSRSKQRHKEHSTGRKAEEVDEIIISIVNKNAQMEPKLLPQTKLFNKRRLVKRDLIASKFQQGLQKGLEDQSSVNN